MLFAGAEHCGLYITFRIKHLDQINIKEAFLNGIAAQRAGSLTEADHYYTAILKVVPKHPATNYNMGILALGLGKKVEALEFLETAATGSINNEQYWLSYVETLIQLGKVDDLEEIIEKAKSEKYSSCSIEKLEALTRENYAKNLKEISQTKMTELLRLYDDDQLQDVIVKGTKLIEEYPKAFMVWNILGAAHNRMMQSKKALQAFEKVTQLNPQFPDGFNNLGVTFRQLNRQDDAIAAFERALYLRPDFAEAHKNIGNVFKDQGNYEKSAEAYKNSLKFNDRDPNGFHSLAIMLQKQGKRDEAADAYQKALKLNPGSPNYSNNLGVVLQEQGKLDKAVDAYSRALSLKPDYADAHNNLGVALKELGNLEAAMEAYHKAVSFQSDYADARDNMGRLHWLRQDFIRAFELMEWRWKKKQGLIGVKLSSNKPIWSGSDKNKVFVWKEQGIGDEIMFASVFSDAHRKSKKLIVECDKRLLALYRRSFPKSIKFIDDRKTINEKDYDAQIAIGSLPLTFRRELRDFSDASSGWLKADARKVKGLRKKLEAKPNEKVIGITWFTNASDPRSKRRNIPVDLFSKYLTQIPAKYVNLQYGETVEDLSKMRSKFALDVSQVDSLDLFNDLDGLAALISACDIVISIDNATVHLAGALGVDTRVLLPFAPDDRWGINQKDSYWYDSLTLYRQETQGDWQKPFETLKKDVTSISY